MMFQKTIYTEKDILEVYYISNVMAKDFASLLEENTKIDGMSDYQYLK